jgi:hypothetical protein
LLLLRIVGAVTGDNPMESRFHSPASELEETDPAVDGCDGEVAAAWGRLPLGGSGL